MCPTVRVVSKELPKELSKETRKKVNSLEDESKPVDNIKNEEKDWKRLQEKLINPEKEEILLI